MKNNKKVILISLIFILAIVLDQFTKIIMINKDITIIEGFIKFSYLQNNGMAFGLLPKTIIIAILSVFIIGVSIFYIIKNKKKFSTMDFCFISCIFSGGISNLIDRFFRGYVVDFIKLQFIDFPVFNIADIFITIGIIYLIGKQIYIGIIKKS